MDTSTSHYFINVQHIFNSNRFIGMFHVKHSEMQVIQKSQKLHQTKYSALYYLDP